LSLKLIEQLRQQSGGIAVAEANLAGRSLREIKLSTPIRYADGDSVEGWLNSLLCLDATIVKPIASGAPLPELCDLYAFFPPPQRCTPHHQTDLLLCFVAGRYYVNRDTLFSYHKVSETFLQRMMALYVSSHYKNSPNDMMLMSDAPAHHLFVLLPPIGQNTTTLPEILAVVQICLEGEISRESVVKSQGRGQRASGDLIPWTISQQFQDDDFPSLSGGRVVRIAVHPEYQAKGYGSRALSLLKLYYEGRIANVSDDSDVQMSEAAAEVEGEGEAQGIKTEKIKPRQGLPPLLLKLSERPPEKLHWLGVSFGITPQLFGFWKRSGYVPTYLRLTQVNLFSLFSFLFCLLSFVFCLLPFNFHLSPSHPPPHPNSQPPIQ